MVVFCNTNIIIQSIKKQKLCNVQLITGRLYGVKDLLNGTNVSKINIVNMCYEKKKIQRRRLIRSIRTSTSCS